MSAQTLPLETPESLIDGLASMAEKVGEFLLGVIEDAVNGVLEFLGIHSPSRLFIGIGQDTGAGLVLGLRSSADDVADAYSALVTPPPPPPPGGYSLL